MSVKLADVIAVLDEAYPPRLAEAWDSVGLVCGDPDDKLESVTVAVDATPAVVDEVPDAGLLLAHHPLLLRGVDTVAASTPKGALVHRMIRTGRSLFTAHTNADSANPGVSDALAAALGLDVEAALEPATGAPDLDKWVIYVPNENAEAVQAAVFDAGAGHIGDYSHCSWTVTGIGQFLPHEGASPAVGSVGNVERVPETGSRSSRPRGPGPRCWRPCAPPIPTRSPRSTSSRWSPPPGDAGLGRVGTLTRPEPLRDFVSRVHAALPRTSWGVRAAGDPDMPVSRVAVCGGAGDSLLAAAAGAGVQAYVTADLRHHPADEHRRASDVALIDVAHWASEFPWCEQAADLLRSRFGAELAVRVSSIRTDPWNVERGDNESGGEGS